MTASWLEDYLRERIPDVIGIAPEGEPLPTWTMGPGPELTVRKMVGFLPVSTDLAMDMGIIPDTRPLPGKSPIAYARTKRARLRSWWRWDFRPRLAKWLYERISGDEFPEYDPYDD